MVTDKRVSELPVATTPTAAMLLLLTDATAAISYKIEAGNLIALISLTLPTHANNAAAVSAGLPVGRLYKTATGEVRIVVA